MPLTPAQILAADIFNADMLAALNVMQTSQTRLGQARATLAEKQAALATIQTEITAAEDRVAQAISEVGEAGALAGNLFLDGLGVSV